MVCGGPANDSVNVWKCKSGRRGAKVGIDLTPVAGVVHNGADYVVHARIPLLQIAVYIWRHAVVADGDNLFGRAGHFAKSGNERVSGFFYRTYFGFEPIVSKMYKRVEIK